MINDLGLAYLHAMGVTVYQPRPSAALATTTALHWQQLEAAVSNCQACELHCTRTKTVLGAGAKNARLVIIGEAPGFHEDQQGEPFVGRAGQLLQEMLYAIALTRAQVYISNILKCRPPANRDPQATEVQQCTPFLQQQLDLIKPELILALGKIAANFLLNTETALTKLRRSIHSYGASNIPILVTYHPAYLLRNPRAKAAAYEDLQLVVQYLRRGAS